MPLEELAYQLDIVDITTLETEGFEGGLVTDETKSEGIILVNESSTRKRQRFTIGHELGHFLCPSHKPTTEAGFLCSPEDMRRAFAPRENRASRMEVEANRFAAQLLLPKPHFMQDLHRHQGADIEHIISLANRYDTSKEATARRYIDLHEESCAAVISHQSRVQRFYRSESFPFIEITPGQSLPQQSPSANPGLSEGVVSEWQEVDAAFWLPSGRGRHLPALYEQVLPQRGGYRLTLLTVEGGDEIEEEDDLVEPWKVKFHR